MMAISCKRGPPGPRGICSVRVRPRSYEEVPPPSTPPMSGKRHNEKRRIPRKPAAPTNPPRLKVTTRRSRLAAPSGLILLRRFEAPLKLAIQRSDPLPSALPRIYVVADDTH